MDRTPSSNPHSRHGHDYSFPLPQKLQLHCQEGLRQTLEHSQKKPPVIYFRNYLSLLQLNDLLNLFTCFTFVLPLTSQRLLRCISMRLKQQGMHAWVCVECLRCLLTAVTSNIFNQIALRAKWRDGRKGKLGSIFSEGKREQWTKALITCKYHTQGIMMFMWENKGFHCRSTSVNCIRWGNILHLCKCKDLVPKWQQKNRCSLSVKLLSKYG